VLVFFAPAFLAVLVFRAVPVLFAVPAFLAGLFAAFAMSTLRFRASMRRQTGFASG
jgi:hypothetical protein